MWWLIVLVLLTMYLVLPASARPFSRTRRPTDLPLEVPPADERIWLMETLADLVTKRTAEPLLAAPLVLPDPIHFPDPWTPSRSGADRMLRRLMQFARLDFLDVRLVTDSALMPPLMASEERSERHVAAWFAGIEDGVAYFGIGAEQLRDPAVVAGNLAHEVAHAYRQFHSLEVENPDLEELLTDATTFFLGFGVLTTNLSYRYRVTQEIGSSMSRWSAGGYLPAQAMAYLLAIVVRARGLTGERIEGVLAHLEELQRGYLRQSLKVLDAEVEPLREALNLSRAEEVPAPWSLSELQRPIPVGEADEAVPVGPSHNLGRRIGRITRTRSGEYGFYGLLLGCAVSVALLIVLGAPVWALALAPAGGLIVGRWRGATATFETCGASDCGAFLELGLAECPRCGAILDVEPRVYLN